LTAKERVEFVYALEGDVREVDVFALAPALVSLGNIIQEASRTLYPENPPVSVCVRPAKEGSYLTDVVLSFSTQVVPLLATAALAPGGTERLSAILKMLGLVCQKGTKGVLKVIELLQEKPKSIKPLPNGKYRYENGATHVDVDASVHGLLNNQRITQNFYTFVNTPLRDQRVKAVRTYSRRKKNATAVTVTREDLHALKQFSEPLPLPERAETTTENETTVLLNPKRGAFEGDGTRWSFHKGSEILSNVAVKDERFLDDVDRGVHRLNHNDVLKVRLIERQRLTPSGVETTHEIAEVLQYIKGADERYLPELTSAPNDEPEGERDASAAVGDNQNNE
jgi:hypothetical protein